MNKRLKTIVFFSFVLLSLLSNVVIFSKTWDRVVAYEQQSLTIGSWNESSIWQPNIVYQMGDVVFHNGQYWIRTSNAGNKIEPSDRPPGRNFWQIYN